MLKRIWKDPVWASVIATGIGGLWSYLAGWWPAIVDAWQAAWGFLGATSPISHWIVAVLVLMAVPTLVVGVVLVWQLFRPTSTPKPDWRGYTEDNFFGLHWRWSYSSIGQIQQITMLCPGGINNQVQHPAGKVPRWASTTNNSLLKNERRS